MLQSLGGTAACFAGGVGMGLALLRYFEQSEALQWTTSSPPAGGLLGGVLAVSAVSALVESLPAPGAGGDNITVPLAALLTSWSLWGS